MPSSEAFLSSSELEEVVLEENWYFLFTVMGMLQLSRYLGRDTQVHYIRELLPSHSTRSLCINLTGG